ncbi:hypothetical protein FALCPG4_014342 [Fusarium falciforme]
MNPRSRREIHYQSRPPVLDREGKEVPQCLQGSANDRYGLHVPQQSFHRNLRCRRCRCPVLVWVDKVAPPRLQDNANDHREPGTLQGHRFHRCFRSQNCCCHRRPCLQEDKGALSLQGGSGSGHNELRALQSLSLGKQSWGLPEWVESSRGTVRRRS